MDVNWPTTLINSIDSDICPFVHDESIRTLFLLKILTDALDFLPVEILLEINKQRYGCRVVETNEHGYTKIYTTADGVEHGLSLIIKDGMVLQKGIYSYGKRNGHFISFRDDGSKRREGTYVNDVIDGFEKKYNVDGSLSEEYQGTTTTFHGIMRSYFNNGWFDECTIVNNVKQGDKICYRADRSVWRKWQYVDGECRSITTFHANGGVKDVITWANNAANGLTRVYYESGSIRAEIEYRNDQMHGLFRRFNEDGTIYDDRYFENGVEVVVE